MGVFDPRKVIIDCSGELEDVLALLQSFAGGRSCLEVLLISVTNLDGRTEHNLNNVVSMFNCLKEELSWRRQKAYPLTYDGLADFANRPTVAVGCNCPLDTSALGSDYDEAISTIWQRVQPSHAPMPQDDILFDASRRPAHEEILRMLRDHEPGSITIVAIGPLTTIATASRADPGTFLRVKEVLVAGGTMDSVEITGKPGSSISQDPIAAAQLFALSSTSPRSTMPPMANYPEHLDALSGLRILLFPQSSTKGHTVRRTQLQQFAVLGNDSPLLLWIKPILEKSNAADSQSSQLHVPGTMAIHYAAVSYDYEWSRSGPMDVRVNLTGDTKGLYVMNNSNVNDGNRLRICSNDAPYDFGLDLVQEIFAVEVFPEPGAPRRSAAAQAVLSAVRRKP